MSTLTIQELPPCPTADSIERIGQYMEQVLVSCGVRRGEYVFLPSLRELSLFFNSAMVDTYEALQSLALKGFDYRIDGQETPITCWHRSCLQAAS